MTRTGACKAGKSFANQGRPLQCSPSPPPRCPRCPRCSLPTHPSPRCPTVAEPSEALETRTDRLRPHFAPRRVSRTHDPTDLCRHGLRTEYNLGTARTGKRTQTAVYLVALSTVLRNGPRTAEQVAKSGGENGGANNTRQKVTRFAAPHSPDSPGIGLAATHRERD